MLSCFLDSVICNCCCFFCVCGLNISTAWTETKHPHFCLPLLQWSISACGPLVPDLCTECNLPTIPTRQTGLVSLGTGTCNSAGNSACTGDVWLTRAACSASPRPGLQTDPALGRLPKERAWPSRTCWPSWCISGDTKCKNEDNCESPVFAHAHLFIFFFRTACVFTKACLAAPVPGLSLFCCCTRLLPWFPNQVYNTRKPYLAFN